jgi:hypothetical protein
MNDVSNLDNALVEYRSATAMGAPVGFAAGVMDKLPIRFPVNVPRFFMVTSLGAAAASILLTFYLVNKEDAVPPALPEFTCAECDMFSTHP